MKASAPRRPAVVLVSGGLDSATCLAIAREQGHDCYALSFSYGQRHAAELAAAARVAAALGALEHRVADGDDLAARVSLPAGDVGELGPGSGAQHGNAQFALLHGASPDG